MLQGPIFLIEGLNNLERDSKDGPKKKKRERETP